ARFTRRPRPAPPADPQDRIQAPPRAAPPPETSGHPLARQGGGHGPRRPPPHWAATTTRSGRAARTVASRRGATTPPPPWRCHTVPAREPVTPTRTGRAAFRHPPAGRTPGRPRAPRPDRCEL